MISTHEYSATLLEGAGHELAPRGGRVQMDEGRYPHVAGILTIPIPTEEVQELLDPRESRRIEIGCTASYHPLTPAPAQARTFDLGLRGRRINHAAGTIEIDVASDEALLMDDVWLDDTPNTDATAHQDSLRAIIDQVLARIGASLEPGTVDSSFYILEDAINLITNPSIETNATGYGADAGATALARVNTFARSGSWSLRWQSTSTGVSRIGIGLGVTAGKSYTITCYMRSSVARSMRMLYRFFTAPGGGSQVGADAFSATIVDSTSGWTKYTVTVTVPATAVWLSIYPYAISGASGDLHYLDDLAVVENKGTPGIDYSAVFDGDTADTTDYGYNWTGTPHASTSTRSALVDRSPEMLNWQPGESAWDFLQPLFQAAGLRLFCDEQRRWFLVDAGYIADGQTQIAVGTNATRADDEISRDRDEWCDAALVVYRWNDVTDTPTVRYDWFAPPGYTKVRVLEVNRPYPGPGFAEYVVARTAGKGRQITVSAVSQYKAQPGQPITITLPATPIQTGLVASIEWSLDDDEMTITSRGLTDTPPDAWIFGNPDISWLDVPSGMSWNTFDWSGI